MDDVIGWSGIPEAMDVQIRDQSGAVSSVMGRDSSFDDLNLSPHDALAASERVTCTGVCRKKRRYFCSECVQMLVTPWDAVPSVQLPLHVDILQFGAETPQRSTAQHIPLLAPGYARVWRPFPECAEEFRKEVLDESLEGSVAILYVDDQWQASS